MDLSYWEKQLILYTKGHYKRRDYNKDLKLFPAKLYDLELKQVKKYNTFVMVVGVYQTLVDKGHIKFTLEKFIVDIFKRSFFERGKNDEVKYNDIIRQMLAEIQNVKVLGKDLELGKPNAELLKKIQKEIDKEYILELETQQNKKFQNN